MSKGSQHIVILFILIFSACSFATFVVSFIGSRWYACRSKTSRHYDAIISLWKYCARQTDGKYICYDVEDESNLTPVLKDFEIIRVLSIISIVSSSFTFVLSLLHCLCQSKKKYMKVILLSQIITAILTVIIGISSLFYSSIRAQDIVGENIKYTFGWSCVVSWIATFLSFFIVILSLVLMCMYFDDVTQRRNIVREELNMDNLSITSNELTRISRELTVEDSNLSGSTIDNVDLSINVTNVPISIEDIDSSIS